MLYGFPKVMLVSVAALLCATQDVSAAEENYTITAKGEIETSYNDNIYRKSSSKTGDVITKITPQIKGESNWEWHSLKLDFKGEIGQYADETSNNYNDFDAGISGRYDFSKDTNLALWLRYRYDHMNVGEDPDEPASTLSEPPIYKKITTGGELRGAISSSYKYDLKLTSLFYDYDNTPRKNGSVSVYDDKDRNENEITGTVTYNPVPDYGIYAKAGYNDINYDKRIDSTLLYDHDANGYTFLVGALREGDKKNYWDIGAGYRKQDYKAPEFKDVNMLVLNAKAGISLGENADISLDLSRDIRESSNSGVSSYIRSKGDVKYRHRFDSDWSGLLGLGYTIDDFQSNTAISGIDREDKTLQTRLGCIYKISKNAKLGVEYKYLNRDSNDSDARYDANIIGLRLGLKP